MKRIFTFLLLFTLCNLFSQERISNFEGGLVPQEAIYIGQYDGHLYYYDERQDRTNILKENLQDATLESELVLSIDRRSSFDFDRILLTDNKLVFEDSDNWQIYDLDNQEIFQFIHPDDVYFSDPLYAYGFGFMLHSDSILQVDLNNGDTKSYVKELRSESEFYFYDELNSVLIDSFAITIDVDQNTDEQHFLSLNVFNGKTEMLHTFDTYDFYFNPIFDKEGFYLQVVNTFDETHRLYSFKAKKGGVELTFEALEIPAEFAIDVVNEKYCYATDYDFSSGESIVKLYLQDFESNELRELEFSSSSSFREELITNEGLYFFRDGDEFGLVNFEGDTTVFVDNVRSILVADTEYSYTQGYIDDENILINFRFDDGSIKSSLLNKDGVVFLDEPFISDIIYDERLDQSVAYMTSNGDSQQIGVVENQELVQLHEDNLEIKAGGDFDSEDISNSIVSGTGSDGNTTFYRLGDDYKEVVFSNDDLSSRLFTMNDELHFISKEGDENFLHKINLETNQIEVMPINLNGNNAFSTFNTKGGKDFAITAYSEDGVFKLASLTLDGNFQPLIDSDNLNGYNYSFFGDTEIVNGNIFGLVENSSTGTSNFVRFGKTYEETQVLFEDVDPFESYINNVVEGENWSFIEYTTPFLVKNDGTYIEENSIDPFYSDGKFYFTDKIFDEEQELLLDWNSNLTEIVFVNNGIAYDNRGNRIEAVNIETLEKIELEFYISIYVKFFNLNGMTAVLNFNTDKVLITDGTEVGTNIIDANYPFNPSARRAHLLGKNLIYTTYDSSFGNELVALNLETGEDKIFDINSGEYSSNPDYFYPNENDIYFIAYESQTGEQLYRLSGNMVLSVVSLDEKAIGVDVFPNPTADYISIDEDITYEQIAIFSVDGSLLNLTDSSKRINVSELTQGTYFVKILDKGSIVGTGKFVKI